MNDREIDEALRHERDIEPPPFFARRLMAILRAETQFAPLPFPWKRLAAAFLLLLLALAAGLQTPELTMPPRTALALALLAVVVALLASSGVRWHRHRPQPPTAPPPSTRPTALLLTLFLATPAMAAPWRQYADPAHAGYDAQKLAETRAFADQARSGAVMAVANGRVIAAWGAVDRKFELHSVRKSIYSALWGIAEAKGLVRLDATLAELGVDDLAPLTAEEKKARLADLLQARSGVYHPSAYAPSDMEAALPARGSHPPGTFWFYNNWDFNVAGALLEQVTGKPLAVLFDEWIARPLGMEDFSRDDVTVVREPGVSRWPAITMRMSARDLARFGQMWLSGSLLPAKWIERASAVTSATGRPGEGYGMMWWTYEPGAVDARQYPHASKHRLVLARGTGGQTVAIVRDLDLVIVHRADTDHGRHVKGASVWTILDRIIGARTGAPAKNAKLTGVAAQPFASQLPPYERPKAIELDAKTKEALTGEYEVAPGVTARVFLHDGRLYAFMPGKGEAELFAISPSEFFLHVDPTVRIRFENGSVRVTN